MERFPLVDKTLRRTLVQRRKLVQSVLFVCSLVWIFLFPLVCISSTELKCRGTYMSENALMPGDSRNIMQAKDIPKANKLDLEMMSWAKLNESNIIATLLRHGATDVFVHKYEQFRGQIKKNYIAVLRPRSGGDRREGILLVTSLPKHFSSASPSTQTSQCCSGLSLLLVLLNQLQQVNWLSKNIVLLVSETEYGVHEFLKDYHYGTSTSASKETHFIAAEMEVGRFAAGIVLQLERPLGKEKLNTLALATQGMNGQLPNMDLLNVASRVINARTVMDTNVDKLELLREVAQPFGDNLAQLLPVRGYGYAGRMENVFRFMRRVAFSPSGWHSQLLPYRIDALTVAVEPGPQEHRTDPVSLLAVVAGVQQVIRSVSNLDEKLHQSFYLYLMPDLDMFVSINEYAGPMVLILTPIILDIGYLVYPKKPLQVKPDKSAPVTNLLSGFMYALGLVTFAMLAGGSIFLLTSLRGRTPSYDCEVLANHAMGWIAALAVMFTGVVCLAITLSTHVNRLGEDLWTYSKLGLYAYVFVAFTVLGVLNFPFAWFSALVTVPVYRACNHSKYLWQRLVMFVLWLLSCPLALLWVFSEVLVDRKDAFWLAQESTGCDSLEEFNPLARSLAMLMVAFHRYNDLHWPLLCFLFVPLHTIVLWIIVMPKLELPTLHVKED